MHKTSLELLIWNKFHHSLLNIKRDHAFALPHFTFFTAQNCMSSERLFSVASFLPQTRVILPDLISFCMFEEAAKDNESSLTSM